MRLTPRSSRLNESDPLQDEAIAFSSSAIVVDAVGDLIVLSS